ncbi:hypothetical protein F5890DRAFT_1420010 [Lentinula detonsa]|uniref:Uncharacterized protein n=1 Tax=Lentinula detonsa TaxID=2804962 RepID=A0AA38PRB5_9AGAR|nr:hypothetical protein F5890DRAFT_1420010 [Lentinula detonsa]
MKNLRESKGATAVFSWPKDIAKLGLNETRARGLHNHLNHPHFGFKSDPVQRCFGDPLAERLEYILTQHAPFSGELSTSTEVGQIDRFLAYRISDHAHLLLDSAYEDSEHVIPTRLLEDPDFDPGAWFARSLQTAGNAEAVRSSKSRPMGDARATRIIQILNNAVVYPGDDLPDFHPRHSEYYRQSNRFNAFLSGFSTSVYIVEDAMYNVRWPLTSDLLSEPRFDVYRWYCKWLSALLRDCICWNMWEARTIVGNLFDALEPCREDLIQDRTQFTTYGFELNGVQIPADKYAGLQRNAARIKDPGRKVARPIIIVVRINGHPVTALLDSGSLLRLCQTN